MEETSPKVGPSQSPSFSTYTTQSHRHNQSLSDIAARVIHELNLTPFNDDVIPDNVGDTDTDTDFEFAVFRSSPVPADEIFSNGQIKPLYHPTLPDPDPDPDPPARLPLRRLLMEERETNAMTSSSSSESDELEGVPPESYCVWDPTARKMKKKSKSAGSHSKRWRIRDLLYRSNSDGGEKGSLVFPQRGDGGDGGGEKGSLVFSHRDSAAMEEKRGKLDYVVGFFAGANGISRTVRPF